jgi:hypothetical protein
MPVTSLHCSVRSIHLTPGGHSKPWQLVPVWLLVLDPAVQWPIAVAAAVAVAVVAEATVGARCKGTVITPSAAAFRTSQVALTRTRRCSSAPPPLTIRQAVITMATHLLPVAQRLRWPPERRGLSSPGNLKSEMLWEVQAFTRMRVRQHRRTITIKAPRKTPVPRRKLSLTAGAGVCGVAVHPNQ